MHTHEIGAATSSYLYSGVLLSSAFLSQGIFGYISCLQMERQCHVVEKKKTCWLQRRSFMEIENLPRRVCINLHVFTECAFRKQVKRNNNAMAMQSMCLLHARLNILEDQCVRNTSATSDINDVFSNCPS